MGLRNASKRATWSLRAVLAFLVISSLLLAACAAPASVPSEAPKKAANEKADNASAKPAESSAAKPAEQKPAEQPKPEVKMQKIRFGYSATDASAVPLWVAKEQGFLSKYGFDAELIFVESGTKVVQTLIAGEIPIATVAGSGVVEGVTSGAELVMIASMSNGFPYKFISSPDVKKPEDLKGKKVGVSKYGSSSDFSVRQALKAMKLDPEKDVSILQVGGDAVRTAALQNGSIQGTVVNPPGSTILIRGGFNELLDMPSMSDLEYQHTGIATSKAYVKNNRDAVQRFTKAIVEAIHFEKTNKEDTKKIIAKYSQMDDPAGVEDSYIQYNGPKSKLLNAAPYPTKKGLQLVLEEVLSQKPDAAKKITADDIIDNSFIKELEDSGFIKALYEKK